MIWSTYYLIFCDPNNLYEIKKDDIRKQGGTLEGHMSEGLWFKLCESELHAQLIPIPTQAIAIYFSQESISIWVSASI